MDEPILLRISPERRRCVYYVLASSIPLALVAFWVNELVGNKAPASWVGPSVSVLLLWMAMIVPLRWAMRIDDQGIARRLLFRWGDPWTGADFASGRIEKRYPHMLYDPARPWWRRRLSLDSLAATDIARAMQRINIYYRLPSPPQLPDVLQIKYGFRRSARLDASGIHLQGAHEFREYLWSDVRRVHITRMDPVRRDFKSLEIALPDRELELKLISTEYGTSPSWRGATAEVVNEFLVRHVPSQRIETDVAGERPARRSDVEKQLAKAKEDRRGPFRCLLIFGPFLVALMIWTAIAESVFKAAFMTALLAIPGVPLFWFVLREHRSRCLKLERQLASFDGVDSGATTRTSEPQSPTMEI
ncbi:MAG: hypothetical protein ACLQNE_01390 [Thermoguttaceae bacterium]